MDGLKDLYHAPDNRVFSERSLEVVPEGQPKKNLYCGWQFIKITENWFPRYTDGCDATPNEPCRNVVTPSIEEVHFLVRALRITLCSIRSRGVFPKLVKAEVLSVIEVLQTQYAPLIELSPEFYNKRDNTWKFLGTSKKPWASSKSLEIEIGYEEERHSGFRALVDGIAARVQR